MDFDTHADAINYARVRLDPETVRQVTGIRLETGLEGVEVLECFTDDSGRRTAVIKGKAFW